MHIAERQRAQPYLTQVSGPLFEQWYLLHHRMVRVVTNHVVLAEQVRHFLYYAQLLGEYSYDEPSHLPVGIPEDLIWQAGSRLHRPIALTCYLFETRPGEPFPPAPAELKPGDVEWEKIPGVDGPLLARWEEGSLRFREYQAYPSVSSCINSVLDKVDLHATIFIENVVRCASWFVTRYVFYMLIGAMMNCDGYLSVHAGAIALDDAGALLVGSPGSGKTTLVLSCLQAGINFLADDLLLLAKDDGMVKAYAFPQDIGVRSGTLDLIGQHAFTQNLPENERLKRYVDVQQYFRKQVVSSCQIRLMLFLHAKNRSAEFRAEHLSSTQAVSRLMHKYVTRERAQAGDADHIFDICGHLAAQAVSYHLWLTPDMLTNATRVRALLEQHS